MSARMNGMWALFVGAIMSGALGCASSSASAPPREPAPAPVEAPLSEVDALIELAWSELAALEPQPDTMRDFSHVLELARRALRLEPSSAAAFDVKARVLLEQARDRTLDARVDHHGLALAREACELGRKYDPRYAPLYLTLAEIDADQDDPAAALDALAKARELDPTSYEAALGFADWSLSVLSAGQAEEAYRAGLALRPGEYAPRLGLVRALRVKLLGGGAALTAAAYERELAAVIQAAEQALAAAPERAEGLYERALVADQLEARAPGVAGPKLEAALLCAREHYARFVEQARPMPELIEQRGRAIQRIADLDATVAFHRLLQQERNQTSPAP